MIGEGSSRAGFIWIRISVSISVPVPLRQCGLETVE